MRDTMLLLLPVWVWFLIWATVSILAGVFASRALQKYREMKIDRKNAELLNLQTRITEFQSNITTMSADIASMDRAEDYGSGPWHHRRSKRVARVNNDREQLADLLVQEAEIKRELGIV